MTPIKTLALALMLFPVTAITSSDIELNNETLDGITASGVSNILYAGSFTQGWLFAKTQSATLNSIAQKSNGIQMSSLGITHGASDLISYSHLSNQSQFGSNFFNFSITAFGQGNQASTGILFLMQSLVTPNFVFSIGKVESTICCTEGTNPNTFPIQNIAASFQLNNPVSTLSQQSYHSTGSTWIMEAGFIALQRIIH